MKPRVLPHSLPCEASVLGGILLRNELLDQLPDIVVEDFYDPKHQAVWMAMVRLAEEGRPIDPVTVDAELVRLGKSQVVGGLAFLGELALHVPSTDNVLAYADELRERAIDREVIRRLGDVLDDVYSGASSGVDALQTAQKYLAAVKDRRRDVGRSVGELAEAELAQLDRDLAAIDRGEDVLLGMPTGFAALDWATGGYPFGVSSLLLADSGMGKSTAAGAATRAASYAGHAALVYSCEDTHRFWGQRALAQESGIDTELIASRRVGARRATLDATRSRWSARREIIIPAAGWSVDQVIRDARARIRRGPPPGCRSVGRLIVIDYLHRVKLRYSRGVDSRHVALGDAMEAFAALAQEEDAAVLVLGQAKRECGIEKRMPRWDECLDSTEPGRIAKFVLGLLRPGKYDRSLNPLLGEVALLKRSQGPADITDEVVFDLPTHTIRSVTEAHADGPQQSLL